jgi:hypothetical protein
MAYYRTKQAASIQVTAGTTAAGATPSMPNHGVSVIGNTTTEIFTLMAPEVGVEKTIVFSGSSSTSLTHTVRGSSAQTVTFSGGTLGGNTALPTMFKLAATRSTKMNVVVSLIGMSSVSWAVKSVYPVQLETTLAATELGVGSVTFSTT